jgi:hypothetical protein
MAFTTPKTWAYKETLSSADMNTYIRDNIVALNAGTNTGVAWTTWTPTLTPDASMTLTSQVNTYCKYIIIGKTLYFNLICTYTIGGTPSTKITVSGFPTANAATRGTVSVSIYDNGAVDIAGNGQFSSGTALDIYKYDGSAFTAGSGRSLCISGSYEIA